MKRLKVVSFVLGVAAPHGLGPSTVAISCQELVNRDMVRKTTVLRHWLRCAVKRPTRAIWHC